MGELNEAVARFRARTAEPAAVRVARPAVGVDRPRPPFAVRRVAEVAAAVALVVLVALRVVGGV
ncbi:hypothetical protein GKE82_26145 [Conexibacter sp. W3-3-2]|uniref:hypothetical protein n=1 Tax=Conexibacter sp. W3-3-2 TaxID=2675227 RepID=UPI0012B934F1|nr:hypothetical protein [Conexibacter sp. W3-3-2]MTD47600.1 hypothetical protein [Conexibacter sp. W3-3-2]MTD47687.1 hypothetical protein [Conexibacter sp. W3-3-2]